MLHGERYIEAVEALLASAAAGCILHIRAYSFDGPGYVEAIELALKNGARVWLLADHSQRSRTKQRSNGRLSRGLKARELPCPRDIH